MTARDGDLDPQNSRIGKLWFLADRSPTLRYIINQIQDYVLGSLTISDDPRKLVIIKDTPLVAWFWESITKYLYIDAEVLHSGLNNEERWGLVQKFNDPNSSLKVLVPLVSFTTVSINSATNQNLFTTRHKRFNRAEYDDFRWLLEANSTLNPLAPINKA